MKIIDIAKYLSHEKSPAGKIELLNDLITYGLISPNEYQKIFEELDRQALLAKTDLAKAMKE